MPARPEQCVFRKTAAGLAELAQRRGALPLRARAVLLMVNGSDPAATLAQRLGPETLATLDELQRLGLVEPLPPARPSRPASEAPAAASPAAPAMTEGLVALRQAQRQLVQLLLPHFGPDAPRIASAALGAATAEAFNAGLEGVAARLAIHMGRRRAAEVLAVLRQTV